MRCPACGREMVEECTHFSCPNILCDYSEEIDSREAREPELIVEYLNPIITWAINH